jgi:DNA-binding response OmpR family regulator
MRILIAEDDPTSRRVLELMLLRWGHQIIVTKNGTEALAEFQKEDAPSLAILDVMMPELSGLDVCRRIRQMPTSTPPYVILLTAMQEKDDVVAGIEAGANDYLVKPFHREELRVRIGVGVQIVELQQSLAARVKELEAALAQVKQLQEILPICSYCKKIRDDENYRVETYITKQTGSQFSHSVCPDCFKEKIEPQLKQMKLQREKNPE